MQPHEKMVMLAVLENNAHKRQTGEDILDKILLEGDPKPSVSMEPGVSLEFLRHVTTDAIGSKLTYLEKIIKIAKYVDRSAADHKAFLDGVPGFVVRPKDTALVTGVAEIMAVKKRSATTPQEKTQKIKDILSTAERVMGPGWANQPDQSLAKLGNRAVALLTHNIEEGIKARRSIIDGLEGKPEEQQAARDKLLEDLETEYRVFEHEGVAYPDLAMETLKELRARKGVIRIAIDDLKKMARALEQAVDRPDSARFMAGIVWEGLRAGHANVNDAVDGLNKVVDFMDNSTVEKLRAYEIIKAETGADGKTVVKQPLSLNTINEKLNSTILGKVGNSLSFKGINLGMEGYAYWQAFSEAGSWQDGMKNVGFEFFKRRAPGVQAVEAYYQEDYFRVGREIVYTLFPPTAIPEGLYGLAAQSAGWVVEGLDSWRYDDMVSELLKGAQFEKVGKN
jgi:hypothetical protein